MSSESDPVVVGLDTPEEDGVIILKSKDGKDYTLKRKNALVSVVVKTAIETDSAVTELPVDVAGDVLPLIVEYMNHHNGVEAPIVEKPLRSKIMKDVVKDAWDAEFVDRIGEDRQLLYDLTLAANYMDIKSLMHLGCAKVASLIKGQPLEKIKEILVKGTKLEGKDMKVEST